MKVFVFVKILLSPVRIFIAGNPQAAAFPQHPNRLRTLYLAKKRVQYVSGLFLQGKAT